MSPEHRAAPDEPGRATYGSRAVVGSRVPSIPRSGVSSPFRGRLSTKSNAFCIGQSSRLSDQYRIRDHMLIHYNKILSAKAAIDCSIPKSLIKSVKYSDQRRREKMKKEVAQLERTSSHSAASSRSCSRESADSVIHRKDDNDPHSPFLRHSPYSDTGPIYSPSSFISSPRPLQSPGHTGNLHDRHPEFYRLHSGLSNTTAWTSPCKFQDNQTKTYSGDLLDKHSHHFTTKKRPFTPRTLKTQAKSALAQSRYYTPPRRKTAAAAETQTDISSYRHAIRTPEKDSSPIRDLERNEENLLLSDEDEDFPEEPQQRSLSREEELSYLKFVADVTNEILTLGLYSDRIVERVFHQHLDDNRHRLDEAKMRQLLDILRSDLNGREESNHQSVLRNPHPKRSLNSSSWREVMNGSSQKEATSDFHGLVSDHHFLVDSSPYLSEDDVHSDLGTKDAEHGDCVPSGADETDSDHHQEDNGVDRLSHGHDGCDLQETAADDHTDQPSDNTFTSSSKHISNNNDLETLEELQQSFSNVIQVSQGNDCDVSDPGEAAETNDQAEF